MIPDILILGGLLLGLASSLHCGVMCGPIAAGFLLATTPGGAVRHRAGVLLAAQAGKLVSYALAGAVLGGAGSALFGAFDRELGFRVLQWGAAASLAWIGLSVAGVLPPLTILDRLLAPVARAMAALQGRRALSAPLLAGLVWGFLPCGMVYAALFTAMLTGSWTGGLVLMAGFGLGTIPAVTVSALGIASLPKLSRGGTAGARVAAGLAIAATGAIGLLLTVPGSPFCIVG